MTAPTWGRFLFHPVVRARIALNQLVQEKDAKIEAQQRSGLDLTDSGRTD